MDNNKFKYFFNAIHYCIWLGEMKWGRNTQRKIEVLLSPIPKYLFTKKQKEKFDERRTRRQKETDKFFYDKETGYYIGWAHHWFGFFYSCYSGFLSWICIGVASREYGFIKGFLGILIFAIPVGLCYIPAYKAVFTNDKYLKYFKRFEKEDAHWHKKWKRNTIMFCIGGIITTIIGFFCMALITSM